MEKLSPVIQETKKGALIPCFEKISEEQTLCDEWVQKVCSVLSKERNASSVNRLES